MDFVAHILVISLSKETGEENSGITTDLVTKVFSQKKAGKVVNS